MRSGSARTLLIFAVGIVLVATLLPVGDGHAAVQAHPFGDIREFLATGDIRTILIQVGGNVALFVPVGFLAPLAARVLRTAGRTALTAAALSTLVEIAQYLLPIGRTASVDDVLLNTAGGVVGYAMFRGFNLLH